jgi:hypothetical protein
MLVKKPELDFLKMMKGKFSRESIFNGRKATKWLRHP